MEKLEKQEIVVQSPKGRREGEGAGNGALHVHDGKLGRQDPLKSEARKLFERCGVCERSEKGGEVRGFNGVIQAAVRGKPGKEGFSEAHRLLRVRAAGKSHLRVSPFTCPPSRQIRP